MLRDLLAFLGTAITCSTYIKGLGWLASRKALQQHLSRKTMHIGNGLLFIVFWPTFSNAPAARFLCASVPALAALHFVLVGLGITTDEALVKSATRSGSRQELLRGPFLYGAVIAGITAAYWRDSPIGVTAIAVLCAGDGLADIVGRRYGASNNLPHSPHKSWAGSGACLAGGLLASIACALLLRAASSQGAPLQELSLRRIAYGCGVASLVGALIESLPLAEVDNVTVPLAVALTGHYVF